VSNVGTIQTLSNSGAIGGGSGGSDFGGGADGDGVQNAGTITTLTNSGKIHGGSGGGASAQGGAGVSNAGTIATLANRGKVEGGSNPERGGAGVSNAGAIAVLANSGKIIGGAGAYASAGVSNAGAIIVLTNTGAMNGGDALPGGVAGGAGVSNASRATIGSLSNARGATIVGGNGGRDIGSGGAGVSNSGMITTLTNSGAIRAGFGFLGGLGVFNSGTIATLTNRGTIRGGSGGSGKTGGAGVSNSGAITTLTNNGKVLGGNGGDAQFGIGGAGGAGVSNSGAIATLSNNGVIEGGKGGTGPNGAGATGDAIHSAGPIASIGPITNTGQIIGNVEIDNQASVSVTGVTGKTFGSWTGGAITIGNGDLTFAGGNTALGDDISAHGGKGTVTNRGALQIASPQKITGSFTQTAAGVLDLDFSGDVLGQYGALLVSERTTLDGRLAIDLTGGFTLATGDRFDVLGFGSLAGSFDALALDGAACMASPLDSWRCGGGVRLKEVINATSLDLVVAHGSAALGPSSSPVPEPSTWAMLSLGFLGLGGLGQCRRAGPHANRPLDASIRLDATNSITLNHVSLSSLVSAEFKFG
jgi:hypothetical protein